MNRIRPSGADSTTNVVESVFRLRAMRAEQSKKQEARIRFAHTGLKTNVRYRALVSRKRRSRSRTGGQDGGTGGGALASRQSGSQSKSVSKFNQQ